MLLVVAGSSCAGKTTATAGLDLDGVVIHDSDEIGVPDGADAAWRQRTLEDWIARAMAEEAAGRDLLLTGQSPLGEVLAAPSAPRLRGIAFLLLDVDDDERRTRIANRGSDAPDETTARALIGWGRWHRAHAADPRSSPEVITASGWPRMRWDRWAAWTAEDPRWDVVSLDTTASPSMRRGRASARGCARRRRGCGAAPSRCAAGGTRPT